MKLPVMKWEVCLAWSDPDGVERATRTVLGGKVALDAVREAATRWGVDLDRLEVVEVRRVER